MAKNSFNLAGGFGDKGIAQYSEGPTQGGFFGQPNDPLSDPMAQLIRELYSSDFLRGDTSGHYSGPAFEGQRFNDPKHSLSNYAAQLMASRGMSVGNLGSITNQLQRANSNTGSQSGNPGSAARGGIPDLNKIQNNNSDPLGSLSMNKRQFILNKMESARDPYKQVREAAISAALKYLGQDKPYLMSNLRK